MLLSKVVNMNNVLLLLQLFCVWRGIIFVESKILQIKRNYVLCQFYQRADPSKHNTKRWSLVKEDICKCQAIRAVPPTDCQKKKYGEDELVFIDLEILHELYIYQDRYKYFDARWFERYLDGKCCDDFKLPANAPPLDCKNDRLHPSCNRYKGCPAKNATSTTTVKPTRTKTTTKTTTKPTRTKITTKTTTATTADTITTTAADSTSETLTTKDSSTASNTLETTTNSLPVSTATTNKLSTAKTTTTSSSTEDFTTENPTTAASSTVDPTTTTTPAATTSQAATTTDLPQCVPSALGMEDRTIPDFRITAESDNDGSIPNRARGARLNTASFWGADISFAGPNDDIYSRYIQVYLGLNKMVTGLTTQGSGAGWVIDYYVQCQSFGGELRYITDESGSEILFTGNMDGSSPVTNTFANPIETILVRLWPNTCNDPTMCHLRLEILGCDIATDCIAPANLERDSSYIIRLNDYFDFAAGMLNFHIAWFPLNIAPEKSFQITLSQQMYVSGAIIQCEPYSTLLVTAGITCVTSFKLSANEAGSLQYVNDISTNKPKIFHVNYQTHYGYDVIPFGVGILASVFKIYPLTYSYPIRNDNNIIMRLELLTCTDNSAIVTLPVYNPITFSVVEPPDGYSVPKGGGTLVITIKRDCQLDCSNVDEVLVSTADFEAIEGQDYTPLSEHLVHFASTENTATVTLIINDDGTVDGDESLLLYLTSTNEDKLGSFVYITITDS